MISFLFIGIGSVLFLWKFSSLYFALGTYYKYYSQLEHTVVIFQTFSTVEAPFEVSLQNFEGIYTFQHGKI